MRMLCVSELCLYIFPFVSFLITFNSSLSGFSVYNVQYMFNIFTHF